MSDKLIFINDTIVLFNDAIFQISPTSRSNCLLLCWAISPHSSFSRPATSSSVFSSSFRSPFSNSYNFWTWNDKDFSSLDFKLCCFLPGKKLAIIMRLRWLTNCKYISSEILEFDSNNWQHVRGSALIISMKAISLAFDISSTKIPKLPPVYEYAGYTLCPANLIMGPFVTFASYKSCQRDNKLTLKLLLQVAINSLLSIVFIVLSSCFLNYLIADHFRWE